MKKAVVGLIIVLGSLTYYVREYSFQEFLPVLKLKTTNQKAEQAGFYETSNPPAQQNQIGPEVQTDFYKDSLLAPANVDVALLLEQSPQDKPQFFERSKKLVRVIGLCLHHPDLCTQTRTAQTTLNRALEVIYEIASSDPAYLAQINRDDLLTTTRINNDNTAILSTQVLLLGGLSGEETQIILDNSKSLAGETKALILDLLSNSVQSDQVLKNKYLDNLYSALSNMQDHFTSYEVQKKLSDYKLSADEFKKAIHISCQQKLDQTLWPVLKKNLEYQIAKADINIDMNHLCD